MKLNLQGLAGAQQDRSYDEPSPGYKGRRFTDDDGGTSPRRKGTGPAPFGLPVALYFDKELKNVPEPARSDYQILVDERADELVHKVMSKYRDTIWKEMAEDRKTYTKDWQEMEQ